MTPAEVDIVVLTVNFDVFDRCKSFLDRQDVDYEGILHVNTDRRPTREPLDGHWTVLGDGQNHSFSESVNNCLRHTHAERVLLLSDDAYMGDGALRAMLDHDDAVVGSVNVNANGRVNHAGMTFRGSHPDHLGRGLNVSEVGECHHVECVTAACMLLSQDAIQTVGELDPGYWYTHEDVDYVMRIREAGFGMPMLCTDAIVHHDEHGVDIHRPLAENEAHFNEAWVETGRLEKVLAS